MPVALSHLISTSWLQARPPRSEWRVRRDRYAGLTEASVILVALNQKWAQSFKIRGVLLGTVIPKDKIVVTEQYVADPLVVRGRVFTKDSDEPCEVAAAFENSADMGAKEHVDYRQSRNVNPTAYRSMLCTRHNDPHCPGSRDACEVGRGANHAASCHSYKRQSEGNLFYSLRGDKVCSLIECVTQVHTASCSRDTDKW